MRRMMTVALAVVVGIAMMASVAAIQGSGEEDSAGSISEELETIYKADQKDRTFETPPTPEQWREISARDAARLTRVKEIVSEGHLTGPADWFHAAMVLQHGPTADDVLMAHVLATVAGFKGHEVGPWLAAAALDRYLHRTGKAQIFGTQKQLVDGQWTQEPYDRTLHQRIVREYGL